ncbi:MAG: YceI family protein [Flavobacteriales bacterium]|nr:YceI family protein [Flavobacteriales bacterium]
MKSAVLSIAALATILVACGPSEAEQQAAREQAIADSIQTAASAEHNYVADVAASSIKWQGNVTGAKVYSHFGTIGLGKGSFTTKGGSLVGGQFVVDMTAITPLDANYAPDGSEQGTKANLIGHLGTADFFDTANHPRATLTITSGNGNTATGDLTIRGKTNSENITDIVITENPDGTVKASGKLSFDRQKYGVAWAHFVKDALLADNIELTVELTGTAAQ